MAELRYQWGFEAPQDGCAPPRDTTVALRVAGREVWRGDVTEALRAWARWCALQVVDLWDCPAVVRRYLETGDADLQPEARAAAAAHVTDAATHDAHVTDAAAYIASYDVAYDAEATSATDAADAARKAYASDNDVVLAIGSARAAQVAHLRTLLLRCALPESLWPLVDGDERVLWDALLEGR